MEWNGKRKWFAAWRMLKLNIEYCNKHEIYTSTEDCYRDNRLPKDLSRKEKLVMTQKGGEL